MINNKGVWLVFLLIFTTSLILFYPSLNYYFFQDDWFVLNWVRTGDFLSFFKFRTDIIYWRPLSMPLFFAINKYFFGLNPQGFHIVVFTLFSVLIISIYHLFKIILDDRKTALLGSFLYAVWPIHFVSLSWLSTTSYIIGPLFMVLSFIFFIKNTQGKKPFLSLASFLFFLLGLASSELTLILPAIFFLWGALINKENYLVKILPFTVVVLIYLYLRIVIFPIPAKGTYQLFFNLQVVNNLLWYFGWMLGLPESFKSLIFLSLPDQSLKVITQFWQITLTFLLLFLTLIKVFASKFKKNLTHYIFSLAWFAIGILPVIFLVSHSYPIYLSFAGLGFLYALLTAIKDQRYFYWIILIFLWVAISYFSLQFTRTTHWLRNEQAISNAYVSFMKTNVANPPPDSVFLIKPANINFSKQHNFVLVETENNVKQSLNDQDAIQVLYDESSLESIYITNQEKVDIEESKTVFEINPR